jgi:hypothetical protein
MRREETTPPSQVLATSEAVSLWMRCALYATTLVRALAYAHKHTHTHDLAKRHKRKGLPSTCGHRPLG